jgi:hypothetical protein
LLSTIGPKSDSLAIILDVSAEVTSSINASLGPFANITATLTAIVNGHKQSRIVELLPWNYPVAEGNGLRCGYVKESASG